MQPNDKPRTIKQATPKPPSSGQRHWRIGVPSRPTVPSARAPMHVRVTVAGATEGGEDATCQTEMATRAATASVVEAQADARHVATARRKLLTAAALCVLCATAEVAGGLHTGSLALLTNATDRVTDLARYAVALVALWLAHRRPTARLSFGYQRVEILWALTSMVLVWVGSALLIQEAIVRIISIARDNADPAINGRLAFVIAVLGFIVTCVTAAVLYQGRSSRSSSDSDESIAAVDHQDQGQGDAGDQAGQAAAVAAAAATPDVNVRAAFIEVLGDSIRSLGVIVSTAIVWARPEAKLVDPVLTIVFAVAVLGTTVKLVRQCMGVFLEAVPEDIDPAELDRRLRCLPGVVGVHHLHVWSLSLGKPLLTAHLELDHPPQPGILSAAHRLLVQHGGIHYATLQLETRADRRELTCCGLRGDSGNADRLGS